MTGTSDHTRRDCFLLTIAVLALVTLHADAGDWHYGAHLVCSDCHTQHNSKDGQPMRTDDNPAPARSLLLRGSSLELCLSCHDGTSPAAPDVIEPVASAETPAGAFPNSGGIPTSRAHHLANPTPELPYGGTEPMTLTCVTCHDPHGNANYRNLRTDPANAQTQTSVIASQAVVANGSNPAAVYTRSNVIYKSGVSEWCRNCHATHEPSTDHPIDALIWGASHANYARWAAATLTRVPVSSPTDDVIPSGDDRVNCLSCHKAHGSPNTKTLIFADGSTLNSTCEECHDQ
jgi:predicted CXXCH cytochrome family protein